MTNHSPAYKDDIVLYKQIWEDAAQIAGIGMWLYNIVTKETVFFSNFYDLFQLSSDCALITPEDYFIYIPEEDRTSVSALCKSLLDTHVLVNTVHRINCGDGMTKYVRWRSKLINNAKGELTILCTFQDVTEQEEMARRMAEMNERLLLQNQAFNQAEEIASIASWQLNLETKEVFYSDNLYKLYGLLPGEVPKGMEHFLPYIHPEDKNVFTTAIAALRNHQQAFDINYRIIRKDGALRYVRQQCARFDREDGTVFIIGSLQDYTDKEVAERKGIRNEEMLREAERISNTGSWERNLLTHELVWSDELYRIYGYEPGSVLPSTEFFINNVIHPEDAHIGLELIEKMYQGIALPSTYRIVRPDGEVRTVRVVPNVDEQYTGTNRVIGIVKDITDQQTISNKLDDTSRMLGMQHQINSYAEQIADLGTWWWYPDTGKAVCSDNLYRLLGLEPQSIEPSLDMVPPFIHPADRKRLADGVTAMLESNIESTATEYRIIRKDGEVRHMRNRSRVIDEGGARIYLGTMQDITEEVRLREQLAERTQFAETLVESSIDRIMALDAQMQFIAWNKKCEELYSLKKEHVIGKHYSEIFPDEYGSFMQEHLERVLGGETIGLNFIPGLHAWGYHDLFAMPLPYGNKRGILIIMHDVTEQILLRKDLLLQRKYAEMLIDASVDRILAIDNEMYITAWNKTCEVLSGIKKEDVIHKKLYERFPKMEEDKAFADSMERALKGTHVFLPAQKGVYAKGYFESYFIPLRDENKKVNGVLNVMHDVTHTIEVENELKAANKSLVKKNQELKHRNAELASFSYVASHDLKEPLRKIYTFIEMILRREAPNLSEAGQMYFKRVQASVQRMGLLIDDILIFSQINNEQHPPADVDLNHILMLVKNNLSDMIESRQATVTAQPLPVVKGHRNLLSQLFQNMISNALKFQKDGVAPEISISAQALSGADIDHPDAVDGVAYTVVSFTDNGIGIERRYSERIFQMFKRLHNTDKYPGTGIGLALCRKIAEMHNGFIIVDSEPGMGSTFHFYLQADIRLTETSLPAD